MMCKINKRCILHVFQTIFSCWYSNKHNESRTLNLEFLSLKFEIWSQNISNSSKLFSYSSFLTPSHHQNKLINPNQSRHAFCFAIPFALNISFCHIWNLEKKKKKSFSFYLNIILKKDFKILFSHKMYLLSFLQWLKIIATRYAVYSKIKYQKFNLSTPLQMEFYCSDIYLT